MAPSQGWLKGASDPGPLHTHRTPGRGRDPSPARCGSGQGIQPAPSPASAASSLESLPGYTKGQVDAATPLGAGEGGVPQGSPGPASGSPLSPGSTGTVAPLAPRGSPRPPEEQESAAKGNPRLREAAVGPVPRPAGRACPEEAPAVPPPPAAGPGEPRSRGAARRALRREGRRRPPFPLPPSLPCRVAGRRRGGRRRVRTAGGGEADGRAPAEGGFLRGSAASGRGVGAAECAGDSRGPGSGVGGFFFLQGGRAGGRERGLSPPPLPQL